MMGKPTTDQAAAVQAADSVIFELSKTVCNDCEDDCWTLAATAVGMINGRYWETWLSYRPHMDTVAALGAMAGVAGPLSRKIHDREVQAAMIEVQTQLSL